MSWLLIINKSYLQLARAVVGLLFLLNTAPPFALAASDTDFAEYQLKAGYLYNFISYTDWPENLPNTLVLCLYGQDPIGSELDTLTGKRIGQRALEVVRINSVDHIENCQVIFVTQEAISNLVRLRENIKDQPILIIADSPGALTLGVAINLITDNNKISFEVNLKAAQQRGLNLSYRLLRLAREVLK